MNDKTTDTLHPFEESGLGRAPFRFIRHERRVGPVQLGNGMTVGAPGQAMGTCQHCGTGIADCFFVQSADSKEFYVGCDCIEKIYKDSNATSSQKARDPVYQAFKTEKRRLQRETRHARENAKLADGLAWATANESLLRAMPNPNREGESLWDQWEWYQSHAGTAGKLKIVKSLCEQVARNRQ